MTPWLFRATAKGASLYGGEGNDSFQMALMTSGMAEGGSGADTFILSGSLKGGSIYGGEVVHPMMDDESPVVFPLVLCMATKAMTRGCFANVCEGIRLWWFR